MNMKFRRRQMMKALGLGTLSSLTTGLSRAGAGTIPSRIVFFVQPHAHVPVAWKMPIPDGPTDRFAERPLAALKPEEFGEALRPLHAFRNRLILIEGLAHTTVLEDIAQIRKVKGDANSHQIAVAGLLTAVRSANHGGGGRSLDQELAIRTGGAGRFGSRVYGSEYVPNLTVSPFAFLGAGQGAPMVLDPATAFADLLGHYVPPPVAGPKTRADLLRAMRPSVLDSVAQEYDAIGRQLDSDGRRKLEQHRDLVRQMELSPMAIETPAPMKCDTTFNGMDNKITQFMRLIRMAFACDLTRVVTYVAPVPQPTEFGYPASANVHASYAHASVANLTACGQTFSPTAERAMIDLGAFYARHFAVLLNELDSIPEGPGTLLDHTAVVWISELGKPTHQHDDAFTLVAGGCNGYFNTGRYVRYPKNITSPLVGEPKLGPGHNRFFVSLMQAMGQPDNSFGMTTATGSDGSTISLSGPLTELQRR